MNCQIINSPYGLMVVPDADTSQGGPLRTTGKPADYEDVEFVMGKLRGLDRRGTAVDVGACLGTWTLALSRLPEIEYIHAIEPQAPIYRCLRASIVMNGVEASCYNIAAGNQNGEIPVPRLDYRKPTSFGGVEFGAEQKEDLGQPRLPSTETIEIVRIDNLLSSRSAAIFFKIDAEGMEMDVISGATEMIRRDRPILFVEFIKSDKEALRSQIAGFGYLIEERFSDFFCVPI